MELKNTRRILLDSSGGPTINQYIDLLANELKSRDCTLQEILISHWHYDHSEGTGYVKFIINKKCFICIFFSKRSSTHF
jgi:metal-dependent hydrolase (beta-lactamase superfamily II)